MEIDAAPLRFLTFEFCKSFIASTRISIRPMGILVQTLLKAGPKGGALSIVKTGHPHASASITGVT
ncbi:hypothetical protein ACO1KQ_14895, partial [Staphylococcus aureus]